VLDLQVVLVALVLVQVALVVLQANVPLLHHSHPSLDTSIPGLPNDIYMRSGSVPSLLRAVQYLHCFYVLSHYSHNPVIYYTIF
jgi:hypothetical protein